MARLSFINEIESVKVENQTKYIFFRQQHLKSKFGEGAEVEIQVKSGYLESVIIAATEKVPGLALKDKFQVRSHVF